MILHSFIPKNCCWREQQNHYKLDLLRKMSSWVCIYCKQTYTLIDLCFSGL